MTFACHSSPQECELFEQTSEYRALECEAKAASNYTLQSQLRNLAVNIGINCDRIGINCDRIAINWFSLALFVQTNGNRVA